MVWEAETGLLPIVWGRSVWSDSGRVELVVCLASVGVVVFRQLVRCQVTEGALVFLVKAAVLVYRASAEAVVC